MRVGDLHGLLAGCRGGGIEVVGGRWSAVYGGSLDGFGDLNREG